MIDFKELEDLDKLQNGETILTTSSSGYFKKGIVVGQVKKIDQKVEIEILAKKNDSIFVKVLVYNYRKNQNSPYWELYLKKRCLDEVFWIMTLYRQKYINNDK